MIDALILFALYFLYHALLNQLVNFHSYRSFGDVEIFSNGTDCSCAPEFNQVKIHAGVERYVFHAFTLLIAQLVHSDFIPEPIH